MPEVPVVQVPFTDLPLTLAAQYAPDGDTFWVETMPAILDRWPQLTPEAYWQLSVDDHAAFVAYLEGVAGGA